MKVIFKDPELEDLYRSGGVAKGRYKMLSRNKKLVAGYQRAVSMLYAVGNAEELKQYSYLHYEKLKYDYRSSIRIQNGFIERLLFIETDEGIEVELLEIDSSHYGNK